MEARDRLFIALLGEEREELYAGRKRVLATGYEPPYGRENIWGVGFGFKGFPPNWEDWPLWWYLSRSSPKELFRRLRFRKCLKVFVGKKANEDNQIKQGFFASQVLRDLGFRSILTDVVEIGVFRPSSGKRPFSAPSSGGNIGLPGGTIGAVVDDVAGNSVMLSCAHVFRDIGHPSETRIVQPASAFGGGSTVGDWIDYKLEMNTVNEIDASIACFVGSINPTKSKFTGVRDVGVEIVNKTGAVSGYTQGVITSGLCRIAAIPYPWGWADFVDVYSIAGYGPFPQPNFAVPGDSGSVIQSSQGQAVGLVIADSPRYNYQTLACRTMAIERLLKVKF